jgi:DNA-binding transcriptional MerR regulator
MSMRSVPRKKPRAFRIGELARASGVRVENIRYYEQVGVMPRPQRSAGNYRVYTKADYRRLLFIQRCRSLNMSLAEVKCLLLLRETPVRSCQVVDQFLDEHIAFVDRQLAALQLLHRELRELRECCESSSPNRGCAILRTLGADILPNT